MQFVDTSDRPSLLPGKSGGSVGRSLTILVSCLIVLVLLVAMVAGYATTILEMRQSSLEALNLLTERRAAAEGEYFTLAEQSIGRLKSELQDRLKTCDGVAAEAEFHRLFCQNSDGLWRVRPELNDPASKPTMYLQGRAALTPSLYRRAVTSFHLLSERGPALVPPFYSVYMDFVECGLMVYAPQVDWGANATPETDNFLYPTMIGSKPENNPSRRKFWTPVYYDGEAGEWMASVIEPLDLDGAWVGTVGHDVSVGKLMNTTLNQRMTGTYNLVMSREGQLIVHPDFTTRIEATKGDLSLGTLQDPMLDDIAALARQAADLPAILRSSDGRNWFAIAQIPGPEWYLVTVYPNQLLISRTLHVLWGPLLISLISLLCALVLARKVVRRLVSEPLARVEAAIGQVAEGTTDIEIPVFSDNELGRLARSFEVMVRTVADRERDVFQSESKYRQLVESANSLILRVDTEGRITFVNAFASRFFGFSPEELLGKNVLGTIVPEHDSTGRDLANFFRELCAHPERHRASINENVLRGGERVWINWANCPIVDESGALTEILCIGNDNTELRKLETQLQQAQKMDAIGQLAGGVAHDFNNLLQIILGFTENVLDTLPPSDTRHGDLQETVKAAKSAATLTHQLLTFSRRQAISLRPLDLNSILSEVSKMIERIIGKHIALTFTPDSELQSIHGDRGQVEQVIMNLCVNARDAMAEGGNLLIETRNIVLDPEYCEMHGWTNAGANVVLSVADTGIGMDGETIRHIFEPFFSSKEMGKGTGLGLATVYGIVHQHNGSVEVYSEVGKGTTFKVYFPARENGEESAEEAVPTRASGGNETILVAEDEAAIQLLLRGYLEGAGYTVIMVSDGEEAVDAFRKHGDNVHLLLFDVMMPTMTGDSAYQAIESLRPGIPCLFASGFSERLLHTTANFRAKVGLIEKPYQRDVLLRQIRQILDASSF